VGTTQDDARRDPAAGDRNHCAREIQKTFDFFRASASGEHIEKIYLAGGSAKVPGLVEALRRSSHAGRVVLIPFFRK